MENRNNNTRAPKYKGILFTHQTGIALGACLLSLTITIFLGYLLGTEGLYRPSHALPATNPITALCLLLLSVSALLPRKRTLYKLHLALTVVTLGITISRILPAVFWEQELSSMLNDIAHTVERVKSDTPNVFALNTSLMLALIATGQLLALLNYYRTSQVLIVLGMLIPTFSLVGYVYHSPILYSQMSVFTLVGGYCAGTSLLAKMAHHGLLRYFLIPTSSGWFARQLLYISIPTGLLGFAIAFFFFGHEPPQALFAVCFSIYLWLVIYLICAFTHRDHANQQKLAQAHKDLTMLSHRDSLTGLYSRWGLISKLHSPRNRDKQNALGTALILVNINSFHKINFRFGHLVGDSLLQRLGRVIARIHCVNCHKGRYSGDIFAVLINDTTQDEGMAMAEEIRQTIMLFNMSVLDHELSITASVGMCYLDRYEFSKERLLSGAEEAVRRARRHNIHHTVCLGYDWSPNHNVANEPFMYT